MEIHFEKVTSDNRKAVENLQVFAEQQTFIESMAENLKESDQFPEWESAGIYDGNQLIGYAMYGRWQDGRVWLDRFLIDQRFQGQGYGKADLSTFNVKANRKIPNKQAILECL